MDHVEFERGSEFHILTDWKTNKSTSIKERGSVPTRPEKKLIKRYRNRRNATSVYYADRTSTIFHYLYFSHKTFSTNDFLQGFYIDPLGNAYQISN